MGVGGLGLKFFRRHICLWAFMNISCWFHGHKRSAECAIFRAIHWKSDHMTAHSVHMTIDSQSKGKTLNYETITWPNKTNALLYLIPSPAPNDHMADSSHTYNSIKGYLTRIIKSYEWKFHNFELTFWVYTPLLYQNLTFYTKLHHSSAGGEGISFHVENKF